MSLPPASSTGSHCCVCSQMCLHTGGPWYCREHEARRSMPVPPRIGWQCPACGSCYAPHVDVCPNHQATPAAAPSSWQPHAPWCGIVLGPGGVQGASYANTMTSDSAREFLAGALDGVPLVSAMLRAAWGASSAMPADDAADADDTAADGAAADGAAADGAAGADEDTGRSAT